MLPQIQEGKLIRGRISSRPFFPEKEIVCLEERVGLAAWSVKFMLAMTAMNSLFL